MTVRTVFLTGEPGGENSAISPPPVLGRSAESMVPGPDPSVSPHKRRRLAGWCAGVIAILIVIAGILIGLRGCHTEKSWPCMVSAKAKKAAYAQMRREGVKLTIQEPAGIDRKAEPVTSGVPLPEGCVKDVTKLCLVAAPSSDSKTSAKGECRAVPCQFTVLSRWPSSARGASASAGPTADKSEGRPDGSIKWVLLDFQADVGASNKVEYVLKKGGNSPKASHMVNVSPVADLREVEIRGLGPRLQGLALDTGALRIGIATNLPGLIHSIVLEGKEIVSPTNPVQVVLVDGSNRVFRASRPDGVTVEVQGPMRTTVRVSGHFVADDAPDGAAHTGGATIFGGKVGYDLRITAYAGKSYLKLDFTLKNDGWYGYRNEGKNHPRQWLNFRSLALEMPVSAEYEGTNASWSVRFPSGEYAADGSPILLTQWFKYRLTDARGYFDIDAERDKPRENAAGLAFKDEGFYWRLDQGEKLLKFGERTDGWGFLLRGDRPEIGVTVRRFRQNFPRGLEIGPGRVAVWLWPAGGFWPRTEEAYGKCCYQFEGGRYKTTEILVVFGQGHEGLPERFEQPLFARAETAWYRDTGAVLPLAVSDLRSGDKERQEVFQRYDRLQWAKVDAQKGDSAGPKYGDGKDEWGKVSIPSLIERCPDIFCGWMNYGDLVWAYGYCSLFYDWPYAMLMQYLRLGDPAFLDIADDMARHRYDIDQYHVGNTELYLGYLQRYERSQHGHLARQDRKQGRNLYWEANCHGSHTWNRGPLLHWALTGDPRSLETALQNGEAFRRLFYVKDKLGEKEKFPYGEFRTPVWAMENWMALYEYTGERKYLDWANEIFTKTLLAMERDNGSCGHIIKDGRQSAQFTAYAVEPVCRLHHLTGRQDTVQFLKRVLDWQGQHGVLHGEMREGKYFPILFIEKWDTIADTSEEFLPWAAGTVYGFLFADGYAYLHRVLGHKEDLDFGRRAFRDALFYTSLEKGCDPGDRMPLGYHHYGTPFSSTPKVHAYNGRYGQLYLWVEEELAK